MSTGISISSINQIKELAEQRKYAEALEILDTQNLDKSINPQFLRISGVIFRENKRYYDSRRILIKAHQMSPIGTRIISDLIELYLELGYFSLAERYYEQYKFYVGSEDTQKEFVEYAMKKAKGEDIVELAAILIPILERMPEERWNFEAILLYHKMDRKDKALDEARYILENYRDSEYVDLAIAYVDDKLDVDKYFYVYPREEQEDDKSLFGDLIEQEEELLQKDYLEMYPPEARIIAEADDNDFIPTVEKKEKKKKPKKPKRKPKKNSELEGEVVEGEAVSETENASEIESGQETEKESDKKTKRAEKKAEKKAAKKKASKESDNSGSENDSDTKTESIISDELSKPDDKKLDGEQTSENKDSDQTTEEDSQAQEAKEAEETISEEELLRQERHAALDKLLAKKLDTDSVKDSAKQIANSVKNIDTDKAKTQVKNVTDTVVDNVKKTSDMIGDAIGVSASAEAISGSSATEDSVDAIMDGIIESVLEPPKQAVGKVVMNEELDAIIPDSLEAMSTEEIADIETRKEERERLELEALEASLRLEEEKKAKRKKNKNEEEIVDDTEETVEEAETEEVVDDTISESFEALRENYRNKYVSSDIEPLESLGFISVVHSDVDEVLDDMLPDTSQMLHQMIDNKDFYSDDNSLGFESKESYNNHGFDVNGVDFDQYEVDSASEVNDFVSTTESYRVEDIYVSEPVDSFEDMISEDIEESRFDESDEHFMEFFREKPTVEIQIDDIIVDEYDDNEVELQNDSVEEVTDYNYYSNEGGIAKEELSEVTMNHTTGEDISVPEYESETSFDISDDAYATTSEEESVSSESSQGLQYMFDFSNDQTEEPVDNYLAEEESEEEFYDAELEKRYNLRIMIQLSDDMMSMLQDLKNTK